MWCVNVNNLSVKLHTGSQLKAFIIFWFDLKCYLALNVNSVQSDVHINITGLETSDQTSEPAYCEFSWQRHEHLVSLEQNIIMQSTNKQINE